MELPLLMRINRGGFLYSTASITQIVEASVGPPMPRLQLQQLEVKAQRHPMLRAVLIQQINCRLLHLFEILQPP